MAWFMMAERRNPRDKDIPKRWLPSHIGPAFYSMAASVFVGIFGYLTPYYFITPYSRSQVPSLDPKSLLVVAPLVVMNMSGMYFVFCFLVSSHLFLLQVGSAA
jgi:hypothetical protein